MTDQTDDDALRADEDPADIAIQRDLALKALSVIRHDLRNLLASVTIMAGRMESSEDDRLAKAGPLLLSSMERTVTLGVRAGELASAGRGVPEAVPVAVALDGSSVPSDGADAKVMADPNHLAAMMGELLRNAEQAGGAARVTAQAENGSVVIDVTNDGPAIPDYAQGDLFTPFKGAKRRDGAGVGLPLAARLARLNGGTLELAGTGPEGSTFRLTLPAA